MNVATGLPSILVYCSNAQTVMVILPSCVLLTKNIINVKLMTEKSKRYNMSFEENPRLIDKPDERERCFSIWFYTSNEEMDCNSCSQLKECEKQNEE